MKLEGPKIFLAAPKILSILQLAAEKKKSIIGADRKMFGPFYIETALVNQFSGIHQVWARLAALVSSLVTNGSQDF